MDGVKKRSYCKACAAIQRKRYYQANKEKENKQAKIYQKINRKKVSDQNKKYISERKRIDPVFKFTRSVRSLVKGSIKRAVQKRFRVQTKTEILLGCTIEQLREHLAKQFQEGMSFDNHGKWHIDHIVPLASAKTEQDVIKLSHYTNLQPLWAEDNLKKGTKF